MPLGCHIVHPSDSVLAQQACVCGAFVKHETACCSGGIGQIDHRHLEKNPPEVGMLIIKIGGPAYRIGMGGGAASSVPSGGSSRAELDFNAVQVRYLLVPRSS